MIDKDFVASLRSAPVADDELKASLMSAGWNPHLPAIIDENGVVLAGNRRRKIALENGITPVVQMVTFGTGPEADEARARLAVVSNVGCAGITPADRKRVTERLYQQGMTQAAIGAVMGVSQRTVSEDLRGLEAPSKPDRPKGGRPKSSLKALEKPRAETAPQAVERESITANLLKAGKTTKEIAAELGVGERAAAQAIEHVKIRLEGEAMGKAKAEIDPSTLSLSAQEKLASALRQQQRRQDQEFEKRVQLEVRNRVNRVLPALREREADAQRLISRRKGLLKKEDYLLIKTCLHPDSRLSASDEKLAEAFRLWVKKEPELLDETQAPTPPLNMPNTLEELMAARAAVSARRSAEARERAARRRQETRQ